MSESKHTPGPWKLMKRHTTFDIVGADGVRVLSTSWHNSIRDPHPLKDEAWRNAQMATAAPDLLSIVKRFVALPSGAWHPERHAAEEAELMADALAVIAKAEGRDHA